MILVPRFELIETLKLIAKLKPTVMPGVPTLYNAMMNSSAICDFDLASLKFCISGGAPLPRSEARLRKHFRAAAWSRAMASARHRPASPAIRSTARAKEGSIGHPAARHATCPSARSTTRRRRCRSARMARSASPDPQVMKGYWQQARRRPPTFGRRILAHRRRRLHGRGGLSSSSSTASRT